MKTRTAVLTNARKSLQTVRCCRCSPSAAHSLNRVAFVSELSPADRPEQIGGALDFAIKHGYIHGGWAPHGRLAEDGVIPAKYQLTEMAEGSYRQRTRRNVVDSDATLIVNLGELDGGTLGTQVFAEKSSKPCLVVQADPGISEEMGDSVLAWWRQHDVKILNVAGRRESKRPGICRLTGELLTSVDAVLQPK